MKGQGHADAADCVPSLVFSVVFVLERGHTHTVSRRVGVGLQVGRTSSVSSLLVCVCVCVSTYGELLAEVGERLIAGC